MKCVKCNAAIPDSSKFCNMCGAKIPEKPSGKMQQLLNSKDVVKNEAGILMKRIEPGTFTMGFKNGYISENPEHKITITRPFYMGIVPVTQEQYLEVMGENPSGFQRLDKPVEWVSWFDAKEFCRKLSLREKGSFYRLPSEAEWEYVCRANEDWGLVGIGGECAWTRENSDEESHVIAKKEPNPWGFYDMLGNVWEWCEDWYDAAFYSVAPAKDPANLEDGKCRVLRGGSWYDVPNICRSSFRSFNYPSYASGTQGFRVIKEIKEIK